MTVTRLFARPLLASMFVTGGIDSLRDPESKVPAAKPVTDRLTPMAKKVAPQAPIPEDTKTLVRINAAAQVLGGLALASGKAPRAGALVLAASIVPTTLAGHRFWEETDPGAKKMQRIQFFKNTSMLGGLLIAAVDTDGKPGLAWRASHAGRSVRREARTAARSARREAKLAKAQIS